MEKWKNINSSCGFSKNSDFSLKLNIIQLQHLVVSASPIWYWLGSICKISSFAFKSSSDSDMERGWTAVRTTVWFSKVSVEINALMKVIKSASHGRDRPYSYQRCSSGWLCSSWVDAGFCRWLISQCYRFQRSLCTNLHVSLSQSGHNTFPKSHTAHNVTWQTGAASKTCAAV